MFKKTFFFQKLAGLWLVGEVEIHLQIIQILLPPLKGAMIDTWNTAQFNLHFHVVFQNRYNEHNWNN